MKKYLLLIFALVLSQNNLQAQIDMNKSVGKTEGYYSVSGTGAAVYEIPIFTPEGIRGMTPQVSLVYNSQSTSGVAGKGWDISSLGSITRQPKSIFYKGKAASIRFNKDDQFVLSGNAFLVKASIENVQFNSLDRQNWTGGVLVPTDVNEYRTDIESFCKITSTGDSNNPTSFTVYAKNGTRALFDVQNKVDYNKTFAWNISRIIDQDGNEIQYIYQDNEPNILSEIRYGNGLYKIQFTYETKSCIKGYFLGKDIRADKVLSHISVYSNSLLVKQYGLFYKISKQVVYLDSIVESGRNNESYHSTSFEWMPGANPLQYSHKTQYINELTYSKVDARKWEIKDHPRFLTDVDRDGKDEIVGIKYPLICIAKLDANGVFNVTKQSVLPLASEGGIDSYTNYITMADVTGNGTSDIICFGSKGVQVNSSTYPSSFGYGATWNTDITHTSVHTPKTNCFMADVNGDKKADIVWLNGSICEVFLSSGSNFEKAYNWSISGDQIISGGLPLKSYTFICDINGDGLDDIMVFPSSIDVSEMSVLLSTGEGFEVKTVQTNRSYFTKSAYQMNLMPIFAADINGDGLADMVSVCGTSSSDAGIWVSFSKGDGSFTTPENWHDGSNEMYGNMISRIDKEYKTPRVFADIDGDGLPDMLRMSGDNIFFAKNTGEKFEYQGNASVLGGSFNPDSHLRLFGDINGDGILDVLSLKQDSLFYSTPTTDNMVKMKQVTDGFGNKTAFSYKRIKDIAGYYGAPIETKEVPFNTYKKGSLYAVSEVGFTNETGTWFKESYTYEIPILHLQGRGFLGFLKISSINTKTFRRKETKNRLFKDQALIMPVEQAVFYSGYYKLLEQQKFGYSVKDLGNKRFWIRKDRDTTISYVENAACVNWYIYDNFGNVTRSYADTYSDSAFSSGSLFHTFATDIIYTNTGIWNFKPTSASYGDKKGAEFISRKTNFVYEGQRLKDKITYPDNAAFKLIERTNSYDKFGNPTSVSLIPGQGDTRTTTYTYDSWGRMQQKINALNHATQYEYDQYWGKIYKETDPNNLVTTYAYDNWGNLKSTAYPNGVVSEQSLTWANKNGTTKMPNALYYTQTQTSGQTPAYVFYNRFGREVGTYTFMDFPSSNNIYTSTSYDPQGRVAAKSLPYTTIDATIKKEYEYRYDHLTDRVRNEYCPPYTNKSYHYGPRTSDEQYGLYNGVMMKKKFGFDPLGNLIEITDADGSTISYTYNAQSLPVSITAKGNTTTISYDAKGRRTSITEPNAGNITFQYNYFDELVKQIDAKKDSIVFTYDKLGRVKTNYVNNNPSAEGSATYNYDAGNKALGKLSSVVGPNHETYFTYNIQGVLSCQSEKIFGAIYNTCYEYNNNGQVTKTIYPGGFATKHYYNASGVLEWLTDESGKSIYFVSDMNKFGQITEEHYGNETGSYRSYNPFGMLASIVTGKKVNEKRPIYHDITPFPTPIFPPIAYSSMSTSSLHSVPGISDRPMTMLDDSYYYNGAFQILYYTYQEYKKLMSKRQNNISGQSEEFGYDILNRLTKYNNMDAAISYAVNGRINNKYDAGNYQYLPTKPDAVRTLEFKEAGVKPIGAFFNELETSYTPFNKIKKIYGDISKREYEVLYGHDHQRIRTQESSAGNNSKVTTYVSDLYEEEVRGSEVRKLHYIKAYGRIIAIFVKETNKADKMYWVHTDHLGSYNVITDANGDEVERMSFDVWGNRRNPRNWQQPEAKGTTHLFTRGFTSHEHLDNFGIINMNGRLYDPAIANFFSPDPMAEEYPGISPYAYCANNPLKYTDPTGMFIDEWNINITTGKTTWASPKGGTETTYINVRDIRGNIIKSSVIPTALVLETYEQAKQEEARNRPHDMTGFYKAELQRAEGLRDNMKAGLDYFSHTVGYKDEQFIKAAEMPLTIGGQVIANTSPITQGMNIYSLINSGWKNDYWGNNVNWIDYILIFGGPINSAAGFFKPASNIPVVIDAISVPVDAGNSIYKMNQNR